MDLMKRVEKAAFMRSGAVPVYNVGTGQREEGGASERHKKRARRMVRAIHAERGFALSFAQTVLDSCASVDAEPPSTPEMDRHYGTLYSLSPDTVASVQARNQEFREFTSCHLASLPRQTEDANNSGNESGPDAM